MNDVSDAAVSVAAKMVGSAPVVAFEPDAASPKPVMADAAIALPKPNPPRRLATMIAKTSAAEWESAIESPPDAPPQPVAVVMVVKTVLVAELLESECVTEWPSNEAKMLVAVATVVKTGLAAEQARLVSSVVVVSGDVPEMLADAATDVPTERDVSPEMAMASETVSDMEAASVAASDITSVMVTAVVDAEKVVDWAKDAVSVTVADDTLTAVKSLTLTKLLTRVDWLHNSPTLTTRFEALVISSILAQRQSVDKLLAFDD